MAGGWSRVASRPDAGTTIEAWLPMGGAGGTAGACGPPPPRDSSSARVQGFRDDRGQLLPDPDPDIGHNSGSSPSVTD